MMRLASSWRVHEVEFELFLGVKHEQVRGVVAQSANSSRPGANKAKFGKLALLHNDINTAT